MKEAPDPKRFFDLLDFLCKKYGVHRNQVFLDYSSRPPPQLEGTRPGYYDGLLSYREKNGHAEFLITVFTIARGPLLTLAHEFAHLVRDQKAGTFNDPLRPPDDELERALDAQARQDVAEFQSLGQA